MGRFYKTASANPLDYMHRINAPLMERALQFNDQAISAQADQGQAIGTAALNFKRLADDDPDAALIAKQYNDQVDQLSKTMAADPANWRKQMEPLRSLKKDLLDNYTNGPIAKMQANYGAYQTWKTNVDKQIEKGTLDSDTANAYEQHYLADWRKNGATGFKNGRYNILKMDGVMNNMNIKKELSDGIDKLKASGAIYESPTQKGMYLMDTTHGQEGVTPDRVLSMAMANMSPQLQQYLKSRQGVGLMQGMYGPDGNMIAPYTKGIEPEIISRANRIIAQTRATNPKQADSMQAEIDAYTKKGEENINWNPNSGLSPILKDIVDSNSWMKTTDKTTIKADPVQLPVWLQGRREGQQNADRADRNYWQARNREDKLDRYKQVDDWNQKKLDLQLEAKQNALNAKGKIAKGKLGDMFAKEYMGDIAAPDHNFHDDIGAINRTGDLSAKNRIQEAINQAVKSTAESAPSTHKDITQEYLQFLENSSFKQSTPQRVQEFLDKRRAEEPIEGLKARQSGVSDPYLQLRPQLVKIGDQFNSKIHDWYSTANADITKTDVTEFTPEAKTSLAATINATPQYYFSIDDKGNQVPLAHEKTGKFDQTGLGKIVSVDGGTAGNVQGKVGLRATFDDGQTRWIFPSEKDDNVYNITKNLMLQSIKDKNSVLAVNLKDEMTNNIRTSLAQGRVVQGGKQNIINIGGHQLPAVLNIDGTVMLKDEDGNDLWEKPVSSIARLVDLMTASTPESTKK